MKGEVRNETEDIVQTLGTDAFETFHTSVCV